MSGKAERELKYEQKMQKKLNELPDIFVEYYYFLRADKSFKTIDSYISYVADFAKFCNRNKIPSEFYKTTKPTDINKYLTEKKTRIVDDKVVMRSDSYLTTCWSALNSFYEYLVKNNYIEINPLSKTNRPKLRDNPKIEYLTQDEIHDLLNEVKNENKETMKRDLAILALGFATGLRVTAISLIDISDIDFKTNTISVVEKRNKSCSVVFGEQVRHYILDWMAERNVLFPNAETDALFITGNNRRISIHTIRAMIMKYSEKVTDKKVRPHVMRHSCATNLYEKTGDIYLCAEVLHHEKVSTTQRYATMSQTKKREAATLLDDML